MKVTFYSEPERARFLIKELSTKAQILETGEQYLVQVEICHGLDAIKLFHAGINFGLNLTHKIFQNESQNAS